MKWIPVQEQLPRPVHWEDRSRAPDYLLRVEYSGGMVWHIVGHRLDFDGVYEWWAHGHGVFGGVTHWAKIPPVKSST